MRCKFPYNKNFMVFAKKHMHAGGNGSTLLDLIVVFEGIDVNLGKSETQDNRRKLDSEAVKETFKNPNSGTHLTPQLFYEVAIQTVEDIARKDNQEWVRYQIADGDADVTIARLGTLHHCPVLSNDSDFMCFLWNMAIYLIQDFIGLLLLSMQIFTTINGLQDSLVLVIHAYLPYCRL